MRLATALFSVLAFGCSNHAATRADLPTPADAARAAPVAHIVPAAIGPIHCTTAADCPVPPCGPCTPGALITRELIAGPDCAQNPCRHTGSACNAQHLCVVGPTTERSPSAWGLPDDAQAR